MSNWNIRPILECPAKAGETVHCWLPVGNGKGMWTYCTYAKDGLWFIDGVMPLVRASPSHFTDTPPAPVAGSGGN